MPASRRSLLRTLLAVPLASALAPAAAAARSFVPPDAAARKAALGPLDGLDPGLRAAFAPLPDDRPIPRPGPDDWLAGHDEPGQSFARFKRERHNTPTAERRKLAIVPVGELAGEGMPDLATVCDFAARFFQLPVARQQPTTMGALKARSRARGGSRQYLTRDILAALRDRVPADAYCLTAVTAEDLYPAASWNFVFGEATFDERVGVYSFARFDPAFSGGTRGEGTALKVLTRACKLLAHEVGHMFGLRHCIHYHCVMNGCNHLDESDASPLHACPVCRRKLHHAIGFDPVQREQQLALFFAAEGMTADAERCERRLVEIAVAAP